MSSSSRPGPLLPPTAQMGAAAPLAVAVALQETFASDLTEQALQRLGQVGPRLGALAGLLPDQARRAARDADAAARTLGPDVLVSQPLLGMPMTVKEGLKVAGAPWMMGALRHRARIADEDGTVVQRLRGAGAVIAGVGSMAEMALWPETVNRITGRAVHPLDARRTPGGSSGGDAALVAAGAVSVAVGTDGGGSVRIPAAYCGLYAHKPTAGLVPLTGHVPLDRGPEAAAAPLARFFAPGPMCREASDLWPMLSVMAGPDGIHPDMDAPLPSSLPWPTQAQLEGRIVHVLPAPSINGCERTDPAQIAAVEQAAGLLQAAGARLQSVRTDLLQDAFWIWMGTLRCAADVTMEQLVGDGCRLPLLRQSFRHMTGRGEHTTAALLLAWSARLDPTGPWLWRRWRDKGLDLSAELADLLAGDALLLCPPVPGPAPHHGHAFRHPFNIGATAVFNVLGNPATIAPVLLGPEGLPRAVQIVAGRGADHLAVSAALALARTEIFPGNRKLP
ncbi:MAG: amidase family protein [Pannonibacter sp.]